jgi:hypothetical protein
MKKFWVVLVVVAMTCMSSMAFAADIAVSGSIDFRMRNLVNIDLNDTGVHDNNNVTNERVRLNIDAKAGDALSGRISIENDWDTWGRFETVQANAAGGTGPFLRLREAWIGFKVPGAPVGVKGGHMLLQLGNAWFFRSMKYGSDAWVVYTDIDALHLGIVDIKVSEGVATVADDVDAYAFVATYKLSDTMSAGLNFTTISDRNGIGMTSFYAAAPATNYIPGATGFENANIQNLGVHFSGKVGPIKLNAEIDQQMGDATTGGTKVKFKGNQVVLQGNMALDPVTLNATLARGSGEKASAAPALGGKNVKEYIALLDSDTHYTVVYEYLLKTAARESFKATGTGFGNTTAVSVGAGFNVSKNLMIGADIWWLAATEKVVNGAGDEVSDLGLEIDAKVNWKLYENLSLNTSIGYFMPGDAYKISATQDADAARAIQSVLSFRF